MFTVRDYGIGIADIDRQQIFKPYFKTKDEKSKQINLKSNGIGLSYCKRVAKSLGGDLILNEAVRDGCEFTLHLKLKKSDTQVKVNNFSF